MPTLPTELYREIIRHMTEPADLFTLLTTSRVVYEEAEPLLYRNQTVTCADRSETRRSLQVLRRACQTPRIAACVLELDISQITIRTGTMINALSEVRDALVWMHSLTTLLLGPLTWVCSHVMEDFSESSLPSLVNVYALPMQAAKLLDSDRQIRNVRIADLWDDSPPTTRAFPLVRSLSIGIIPHYLNGFMSSFPDISRLELTIDDNSIFESQMDMPLDIIMDYIKPFPMLEHLHLIVTTTAYDLGQFVTSIGSQAVDFCPLLKVIAVRQCVVEAWFPSVRYWIWDRETPSECCAYVGKRCLPECRMYDHRCPWHVYNQDWWKA